MSERCAPHENDRSLLDQTLYLASRIYDNPHTQPISLDLHSACAIGSYQSVKDAVMSGVDFNSRNKAGWTPLMYASYVGHDTVVNLLLDSGAEASRGTPSGLTPLMVAAGCGNESVCYFLLQAGAEIDSQDSNGYTALVHAVRQGHQTVVQLLLEAGADMELRDHKHGYTALMQASIEGDEIIVDVLIACDADLSAKDNCGETARSLAYKHHHVRTATLLDNAIFMFKQIPGNPGTLPTVQDGEQTVQFSEDIKEDDLFSGAKDDEEYQKSQLVKKSIQELLGRRSGPRWSLPHDYIAARRGSAPVELQVRSQQRRRLFRAAKSMPERDGLGDLAEDEEEPEFSADQQLADFLTQLNLEKYIEMFGEQEIDFQSFLNLTDEDLKRTGITLMGPRKKILVAVMDYKQSQEEEGEVIEERDKPAEKRGEREDIVSPDIPTFKRKAARPKLVKQSSTEVTAAYHNALEKIEQLEDQLAKEHQLRKTTDGYILDLQKARQEALGHLNRVRNGQKDITKHFKAVKGSYGKLSDEVDCLRMLSTSSVVDPNQLHKLYSEIISLSSKMGMEFEALSRSVDASKDVTESLAYHLGGQ